MAEKQKENTDKTSTCENVNPAGNEADDSRITCYVTFDDIFDYVKEIDPDFPEDYMRKIFEMVVLGSKGKLKYKDLEPGGRFSMEDMKPAWQAYNELLDKDDESLHQ